MRRLELTIKDRKEKKKKRKKDRKKKRKKKKRRERISPFVADFGCNRQIWISFNDCDDICDPK